MTAATLGSLRPGELTERLHSTGVTLEIGPFWVRLQTDLLPAFHQQLHRLYADYPIIESEFADFHVTLYRQSGFRRWIRPQIQFTTDTEQPFAPFPGDSALPFWEWGLNYCVANRAHQYLMLHAGVLEKYGRALILPAKPGSGKSTLTAALCQRGWRLLSDEFALVRPDTLEIVPFPRLLPLKNQSIEVIRAFEPGAEFGPEFPKTRKGRVAHLRPPTASIRAAQIPAQPGWMVFPQYRAGAKSQLLAFSPESSFLKVSSNSFNYEFIGLRGFETTSRLIEEYTSFTFEYSDLTHAVELFDQLANGDLDVAKAPVPRVDFISN